LDENYTAQQIRVLFLLQSWDGTMNYQKENPMSVVDVWLGSLNEFFLKLENCFMSSDPYDVQSWDQNDINLNNSLLEAQLNIDEALKDNFNTPTVMHSLSYLISSTNDYITKYPNNRRVPLLKKIGAYVTKILKIFGVIEENQIGVKDVKSESKGSIDKQELRPYILALTDFRTKVRETVLNNGSMQEILELCDNLRNDVMPNFGVRLTDDGDFPFDFVDREKLLKELNEQKINSLNTDISGLQKKLNTKENDFNTANEALSTNINDLFKDKNIVLNDDGTIPSTDKDGTKIAKSALKKLTKLKSQHDAKRKKLEEQLKSDPDYLIKLENDINDLRNQITTLKEKLSKLQSEKSQKNLIYQKKNLMD